MKSFSFYQIRTALKEARAEGFTLFPEIRDPACREKVKNNPVLQPMLESFYAYGEEALCAECEPQMTFQNFITYLKDGNRSRYEKPWFRSKAQLNAVVLRELFMPDSAQIEFIEDRLWSWCDRFTWEFPAHVPLSLEQMEALGFEADEVIGLFSAETGFYFAEIVSIIGHKLDPLLLHRVKKEINRRINAAYSKHNFHWEEQQMNWSAVCAGSVGCAALYTMEDDDELAKVIQRLMGAFTSYFEGYDEDGVTPEGVGYWGYGFGFFLYFAKLLLERTNGRLDLFKADEKIEKIANFPASLSFSGGGVVNFSDSSHTGRWEVNLGMAMILRDYYGGLPYSAVNTCIDVMSDGAAKWAHVARYLFLGAEYSSGMISPVASGCTFFQHAQWLVDRRMVGEDQIGFAAKGGHNGEPHNHNDLGHFILHKNGEMLFADLGAPNYCRQYFQDETRYGFINTSSRGHSLPVIDGYEQAPGAEMQSVVTAFDETAGETVFALDLTRAYDCPSLEQYVRTFAWAYEKRALTIKDDFVFSSAGEHTIESGFLTRMKIVKENESVVLEGGAATLAYPPGAVCEIIQGEFVANGSLSTEGFYKAVITSQTAQDAVSLKFIIHV